MFENWRSDIFWKILHNGFGKDVRLIPSAPAFSSGVERDGDDRVGKGEFRLQNGERKKRAERQSKVADELIFEKMNKVCDTRIIIAKRGEYAIMRN